VKIYLNSYNTPALRGAQLKAQGQLYLEKVDVALGVVKVLVNAWK
jgi:hypothetical protein